jgi:hypothetical protein
MVCLETKHETEMNGLTLTSRRIFVKFLLFSMINQDSFQLVLLIFFETRLKILGQVKSRNHTRKTVW